MSILYYDIGLNLFCRQFPDPEKIVRDAAQEGVSCILTGTDTRENRKIDVFTKNNLAYGTAGIHPHNADSARQEDFELIDRETDRIKEYAYVAISIAITYLQKPNLGVQRRISAK